MALHVVRHAHAGERSAWPGVDAERPLSGRGRLQAERIADALAGLEPKRILSSPALRCIETVRPLADRLGLTVEQDDRLFEATPAAVATRVVADLAGTEAVVCSHGDIIPLLLDELVAQGMEPERDLVWQKASTWTAEWADGRWTAGRYTGPPA